MYSGSIPVYDAFGHTRVAVEDGRNQSNDAAAVAACCKYSYEHEYRGKSLEESQRQRSDPNSGPKQNAPGCDIFLPRCSGHGILLCFLSEAG